MSDDRYYMKFDSDQIVPRLRSIQLTEYHDDDTWLASVCKAAADEIERLNQIISNEHKDIT